MILISGHYLHSCQSLRLLASQADELAAKEKPAGISASGSHDWSHRTMFAQIARYHLCLICPATAINCV
jgi:aspartyl/asparaginyl beta-hydroxylase (cupin superfamily)